MDRLAAKVCQSFKHFLGSDFAKANSFIGDLHKYGAMTADIMIAY